MKMFFACGRGDLKILEGFNVDCVLESFFYKKGEPPPKWPACYFLDSGGFTARQKNVKIDVKDYAQYINDYDVKYCFNLDTNDIEETIANQRYLDANVDAVVIPVYHYSDYANKKHREMVEGMIQDYHLISLGGIAKSGVGKPSIKRMYDYVFNKTQDKVKVHGLGMTHLDMLKRYPFYSIDSTNYLSGRKYGFIKTLEEGKLRKYYTGRVDGLTMKNLLNADSAPERKTKKWMDITAYQILETEKMGKFITDLWTKKGVTWDD
jgi:hypothetical protein